MEEAATLDQLFGRQLVVEDARPGGHPLRRAGGDDSAAAVAVGVLERAVHDVRDGLEAPMRVPRSALCLAGRVFDRSDVVEQQERIGDVAVGAGERAPNREARAFEERRGGDDLADGPDRGRAGVGPGDSRQNEKIGDGDGWHSMFLWFGPSGSANGSCIVN